MGSVPARRWVTNPATFNARPKRRKKTPAIQRTGPWAKLVGESHSKAPKIKRGITNKSGGAIGTPGRSSSFGNSVATIRQTIIFVRAAAQKEKGAFVSE